jgi:hypothetical protein
MEGKRARLWMLIGVSFARRQPEFKIEERSHHFAPRPPNAGGKEKARGAALRDDNRNKD